MPKAKSASISLRLESILEKIDQACEKAGRDPREVQLVCVSKKQPISKIQALIDCWPKERGRLCLGENYVQEFRDKRDALQGDFDVHLIGALQRNKARDAVFLFQLIESVHSEKLLRELDKEAGKTGKKIDVYLQVNTSQDKSNSGFEGVELQERFQDLCSSLESLRVKGLMTITRYYEQREDVRPDFQLMRELADQLNQLSQIRLELSMGMSADFDIAIEEGATVVRVGSALFGARD